MTAQSFPQTPRTLYLPWRPAVSTAILLLLTLATPVAAGTASITLAWDASPDPRVDGYIIEWGRSARAHTEEVDVGDVTSYTIEGLGNGLKYYFMGHA